MQKENEGNEVFDLFEEWKLQKMAYIEWITDFLRPKESWRYFIADEDYCPPISTFEDIANRIQLS